MRNNLITRLMCDECGLLLNLVLDQDVKSDHPIEHQSPQPPEPTGAACYHTSTVYVEPCKRCIQKHTGPAKQLAEAISALTQNQAT